MHVPLLRLLGRIAPATTEIRHLARLSGGANQQTWAFDAVGPHGTLALILRRGVAARDPAPGAAAATAGAPSNVSLDHEAELLTRAARHGVPTPPVRAVLTDADQLGSGFVMDRIDGETIPRRILRDAQFAQARAGLASQCGAVLARIHGVPWRDLAWLRRSSAEAELAHYAHVHRAGGTPRPVFEWAMRWLREHLPAPVEPRLVHGDFRNGNLIVGADGLRAVLDWELAHVSDPMEDLGWICVNSWCFGQTDHPVGGFGTREDLFAAYEAESGRAVDASRVFFWEVLGTLKWGVMCGQMYRAFASGGDRSVERAVIGRRASETEIDLLRLLAPEH